jgi:hypothetical protein
MDIPVRSQDFDVAWMEAALADHLNGARIEQVKASRLADPGQTSEAIDIAIVYADNQCPLPKRYLAKLGSNDPDVLAMIGMFGQYRREVEFYQTFPDVGISKPQCYYSACSDDGLRMVLLFEHLAPAVCPSWRPTLAEIELALDQLPAFHAKWWNAPGLKQQSCLISPLDTFWDSIFQAAAAGSDEVLSVHGANAEAAIACVVAISKKVDRWKAFIDSRDYTLIHGDYHGKQMFMPSADGGRFSIIDWQFPFAAEGPWDFARLISLCLPYPAWRQNRDRLIDSYHSGLTAKGVVSYSRDDVLDGIRMGFVISSTINTIAQVSSDTAIIEKECDRLGFDWKEMMFTDQNQMLIDLDAEAFIRSI